MIPSKFMKLSKIFFRTNKGVSLKNEKISREFFFKKSGKSEKEKCEYGQLVDSNC